MRIAVADRAHDDMLRSAPGLLVALEGFDVQVNLGTEIDAAAPDEVADILERRDGVGPAISQEDELASALYERVGAGVVEMPAVREVAVWSEVVGVRKELAQR